MRAVYFTLSFLILIGTSCKNAVDPKTDIRHEQLMMVYDELEALLPHLEGLEKNIRKKRHQITDLERNKKFQTVNKDLDNKILEIKEWKSNYKKPTNLSSSKQVEYMISKQREIEELRKEVEILIGSAARMM